MCNNQIIATIYEMMKFNKVSLEELIEFIDNQKKSYTTYSYDKTKKWGDEAVELDFIEAQQAAEAQFVEEQVAEEHVAEEQVAEEQVTEEQVAEEQVAEEQVAEEQVTEKQVVEEQVVEEKVAEEQENKTSWVSVIKKTKNIRSENIKKPQIVKSQVVKQKVVKQQPKKKDVKQQPKKKDERFVIYTVHEFIQCIKNKQKLHIDFTIDPESHCEHTFNGTICDNVKECGKIHVQRCMNNLDCQYKYCQFLHVDEMPDEEAKENYMDSMNEYNRIKKNKKVYV